MNHCLHDITLLQRLSSHVNLSEQINIKVLLLIQDFPAKAWGQSQRRERQPFILGNFPENRLEMQKYNDLRGIPGALLDPPLTCYVRFIFSG